MMNWKPEVTGPHLPWSEKPGHPPDSHMMRYPNGPIIDDMTRSAVKKQLSDTVSIYGSGGVIGTFEKEFKEYHSVPNYHVLLHKSGTNALQALYYAAGFLPGDEVIFPVYTFHATCSPAMQFGIQPKFCDCGPDGNIDPLKISQAITPSTKAVVVTHLWGIPCDMTAINAVVSRHPSTLLLEDCSHAHGASIPGSW